MKNIFITLLTSVIMCTIGFGQEGTQSKSISISKSLNLYVFPNDGQDAETKDYDEYKCYKWAIEESEIDPMNLPEIQVQTTGQEPSGDAIKGAARGAALGVAIGAISGDAGEGAAIGAIGGAVSGMKRRRMRKQKKAQQAQQQSESAKAEMMDSFKRAYKVCLTSKGYTVD